MKIDNDKQIQNKSIYSQRKPKKGSKRKWLILVIIIVVLTVSGFVAKTISRGSAVVASGNNSTFTVRRDNLTITVTEGGSIRAHKSIEYKCRVERRGTGDVTILNIVPAGTYITQEDVDNGKVLVELDSSALKERLVQEEMELAGDQESVTSAREAYEIQEIDNESDIADGQLNLRFALLDLQKYLGADIANRLIEDVNEVLKTMRSEVTSTRNTPTHNTTAFGSMRTSVSNPNDMPITELMGVPNPMSGNIVKPSNNSVKGANETLKLTELIAPFLEEVYKDPNLLAGSSAGEEWKRLQDNIVLAEGNLKTAQDTLTGTRKLHDANYVSDLELQRDELTLTNRKFARESADVDLNLFMKYDLPKNAEQSLSNYVEAGRRLQRTYAQCRSRLAQAQVRLSTAQQRFSRQQEQVNELYEQIAFCTIKAKAPGLVVYGTGGTGDIFRAMRGRGGGMSSGIIAEGEVVSEGQTIISMPDTATMVAEVSVHETEVDKVRAGQPATIVMDAFPDKVLQGEVIEVAPLPDQQRGWMNPDLKVYETLVRIDGSHDFLRSRMSCKVQILVEHLENAIIVPIQVVSNRVGKKVCYVITPHGPEEHVVQTGLFNDTFVHIIEGLEEGEEVMLNPPLFTDFSTGPASIQQQQPLPEKKNLPSLTDGQRTRRETEMTEDTGQESGQPQEQQRRRGRRGMGMPEGFEMTDEMRQKMQQFMKQGGGQGMPSGGPPQGFEMTDEMRQKMRQFMQQGGGQGMPGGGEMTDEMRQKMQQFMRQRQGGGRRNRSGTEQSDDQTGQREN